MARGLITFTTGKPALSEMCQMRGYIRSPQGALPQALFILSFQGTLRAPSQPLDAFPVRTQV